jgi:hypothetical protein
MDWIKTRFTTALEALTLRRVFAIGGIFAAAAAVAAFVPKISWSGQPMLLNTPAWAWAVMAALLMTLYFVFEYAHRKRMELVPRFSVSFDQDQNGIVQTPTTIMKIENGQLQQTESNGTYVRVRVETVSNSSIRDCVAFLTRLEKRNPQTTRFDPINLSSAGTSFPARRLSTLRRSLNHQSG